MGLHQYEQLILHAKDEQLKETLQKFQKHAKLGAKKVADRIKQLGGEPVDGVGILGDIRLWMSKFNRYPTIQRTFCKMRILEKTNTAFICLTKW